MSVDRAAWVTHVSDDGRSRAFRAATLEVIRGPDKGMTVQVSRTRFRVGALPSNELQLSDTAVSGHHFEIALESTGFRLRDLESRNGTWVAGLQVRDVILHEGAIIDAGSTRISFSIEEDLIPVPVSRLDRFFCLLGCSLPMRELFAELERISSSESTVLITGETGTGKEAVAEALVEASSRCKGPLVVVDCGALASSLIESELFGYEKGAYTGAASSTPGAFERADGGTVLLDEIGELPLDLQPKLLRVLERREVRRVGGKEPRKIDIRVLAATHRSLEEQVNRGTFRADLFYRLAVLNVVVPPLRERRKDIAPLAEYFLSSLPGSPVHLLVPEVLQRLEAHDWPGNVRELRNAVERIALGAEPLTFGRGVSGASEVVTDLEVPFRVQKENLISEFELRYARALLKYSANNLSKAARKAGLDRMAVVKLLSRHGLTSER